MLVRSYGHSPRTRSTVKATPRCRTLMSVAFACSSFRRCSQAGAAVFTSARQDGQLGLSQSARAVHVSQ